MLTLQDKHTMKNLKNNALNQKLRDYAIKKNLQSSFLTKRIDKVITLNPSKNESVKSLKLRKIEQVNILKDWSKNMDTTGITYNKVDLTTCINMRLAVLLAKNL